MSAELWSVVCIAVAAAVLLIRHLARRGIGHAKEHVLHDLACPKTGAAVECSLERDLKTGRYTTVVRCSALPAGQTCSESCLHILNAGIPLSSRPPPHP